MELVDEAELLGAWREGRVLDCADGAARRAADAAALRRCCRELKDQIDPRGIRLRNAVVAGQLELAGFGVPFPLRFDGCEFESVPVVEGAQLHELALTGCGLPGLLGNGLRVRRDLDLSRSRVTGGHRTSASTSKRSAIWLCESDIGGRLLCLDTVVSAEGERSIQADRMHVGGTVRLLHEFRARGEIRLLGARIDGSLDLTGARIECAAGPALDLGVAVIGGSLFLIADTAGRRPVIEGRLNMRSARISGQLQIRNATLREPENMPADSGYSRSRLGGTVLSLSAPRLSVGAEVTLEGTCEVTGGLDLAMSEMSSLIVSAGSSLNAPGRTAIDLTNAELRSSLTFDPGVTVRGTVRLTGASIHGNLTLRGAVLSAPERNSLVAAQGLRVDGDVELQNLTATGGQLTFRSATLGSVVDAAGAQLDNPGGYTLSLSQAIVRGSVRLVDGFDSAGLVVLRRAAVEGRLQCTGGSFACPAPTRRNPQGHAIEAILATIRGGMDLGWTKVAPSVDFTNASTTFLADDPANWPERFTVVGFIYDRFEQPQDRDTGLSPWDRRARCNWLSRQAEYDSGPYEQAARVFRQHGYATEAEEILIAQRRQARRANRARRSFPRRALDAAYGASVGYGYRPGRVLWLLVVLLALVTASLATPAGQATLRATTPAGVVYTTSGLLRPGGGPVPHADACGDGQVRCFEPVLYAIDTVVPLVSLDQRSTWYPDPHVRDGAFMQWWLNIATVLGWLLSSIFVLSFARLARAA
jgi:hypothetical protein